MTTGNPILRNLDRSREDRQKSGFNRVIRVAGSSGRTAMCIPQRFSMMI
jgi:hypothetical protein